MSLTETPKRLEYSFAGKKILITGGGRGVGHALVSRLYNDGAVVFTLEKDPELVSQLLKEFPDKSRLRAEICDISDWSKTQKMIESFGPVHHLVNSAAIAIMETVMNIQEDQVDKTFDVNLKSLFCTSQAVAKEMISEGIQGTIVNIASIGGHVACEASSIYSVSKAGVLMLTKCLAVELGKHGIRVNSISPAGIDTPMFRNIEVEIDLKSNPLLARQPLVGKTMLKVDDVVNTILFLLSPLSSLTTGTDLVVDGGIMAC